MRRRYQDPSFHHTTESVPFCLSATSTDAGDVFTESNRHIGHALVLVGIPPALGAGFVAMTGWGLLSTEELFLGVLFLAAAMLGVGVGLLSTGSRRRLRYEKDRGSVAVELSNLVGRCKPVATIPVADVQFRLHPVRLKTMATLWLPWRGYAAVARVGECNFIVATVPTAAEMRRALGELPGWLSSRCAWADGDPIELYADLRVSLPNLRHALSSARV